VQVGTFFWLSVLPLCCIIWGAYIFPEANRSNQWVPTQCEVLRLQTDVGTGPACHVRAAVRLPAELGGWTVGTPTQHVANRKKKDFRVEEMSHEAVSRRPPYSLYTMVAGTEGYTHAAKVWDLSLVLGPFSVAPWPNHLVAATAATATATPLASRFATFLRGFVCRWRRGRRRATATGAAARASATTQSARAARRCSRAAATARTPRRAARPRASRTKAASSRRWASREAERERET
jgi:hypothetical protein